MKKSILALALFAVSGSVFAVEYVAPSNRIRIWEGSAVSFTDSQYTIGTTTAMGTIRTLKSNVTVTNLLNTVNIAANAGGLDMTNKYLTAVNVTPLGLHQQLTESGGLAGQCVAFAKAMTGAPGTTRWYRGSALTSYVDFSGRLRTDKYLAPGTMIAHFGSIPTNSPYSSNSINPHVAIFLSWSLNASGFVDGINVVDANVAQSVNISGTNRNMKALIQKHKLPWVCNAGASCGNSTYHVTFFSSNYYTVNVL